MGSYGPFKGPGIQVKSSQVLHARRRPLGGAGKENTTLQLHVIIHSVSRCQTAVEHDVTSSSELFGTQRILNDYCVRRCTKSENASHATSKRLLTHSLQLSNPKRAKASRYVCQEFRGLPRIRAPFGDQFIARLTHRSADNVVTWCAKFQYEWKHLQDQHFNRKL